MPSVRVLNSDGPPSTICDAYGFRSAIDLRWYLVAVAWVTVIESLSSAGAGSSTVSVDGSLDSRAASTSAVLLAVDVLSTSTDSRVPLYSGMIVMAPFCTCG